MRVCRLCGLPALLEPHEHRADDPWACADCVDYVLEHRPEIPDWLMRLTRPLKAVS